MNSTGVGFFFAFIMLCLTFLQTRFTDTSPRASEEFTVKQFLYVEYCHALIIETIQTASRNVKVSFKLVPSHWRLTIISSLVWSVAECGFHFCIPGVRFNNWSMLQCQCMDMERHSTPVKHCCVYIRSQWAMVRIPYQFLQLSRPIYVA